MVVHRTELEKRPYRPQGFGPENLDYLGVKPLGSCQGILNGYSDTSQLPDG